MSWSAVLRAWLRPRLAGAAAVLLAALASAGCATQARQLQAQPPPGLPLQTELADTPFFPDDSYFCGPAALATSLSAAGLPARPEALVGQVFLPGREGSLQIEMLAAARRQGAVATLIPGTLVAFERTAAPAAALRAYRGALERWPDNPTLAMGLGNTLYTSGDKHGAEAAFRGVAEAHGLAAAYNNRAQVLLELGRRDEARDTARRGLAVAGPLRPTLLETLHAIDAPARD